jgi:hypothetical protein
MNDARESSWQPDPHQLAAYFDGELDDRCDCAYLRARIEAWLEKNPEAVEASAQLQQLWLDTTPAEPSAAAWNQTLGKIDAGRRQSSASRRTWLAVGIVASCVALVVAFGVWRLQPPINEKKIAIVPPGKTEVEVEVFPVATADEVIVHYIEGRDTNHLVVATLPVYGLLELASHGEVHVVHTRPDSTYRMVPTAHQDGPRAPMIWAKMEND